MLIAWQFPEALWSKFHGTLYEYSNHTVYFMMWYYGNSIVFFEVAWSMSGAVIF